MSHKTKITVIKRMLDKELINAYLEKPERMSVCNLMEDGQEFIVTNPFEMPDGICAWAWADIRPYSLCAYDCIRRKL